MKLELLLIVLAGVASGQRFFDLESGTDLQCKPGEIIGFTVPSSPASGSQWFLIPSMSKFVQHLNGILGSFDATPGNSSYAGAQKYLVRCSEEASGQEIIQFVLVRRSGDDMTPKEEKLVLLRIVNN